MYVAASPVSQLSKYVNTSATYGALSSISAPWYLMYQSFIASFNVFFLSDKMFGSTYDVIPRYDGLLRAQESR